MSSQVVLITGANRGIGRGLTSVFLRQPLTTVIAAVRDVTKESSQSLAQIPMADGSRLILVKMDLSAPSDAAKAIEAIQKDHGIDALDIVIANAGISHSGTSALKTPADVAMEHFSINSLGPIVLLQATAPLLRNSKKNSPKFVAISSIIGTISGTDLLRGLPHTTSPYGSSKAALNWFVRRLHVEEEWLVSFVFHPGLVLTDMVARSFSASGADPKKMGAISVEESVEGLFKVISSASREETSGTFRNFDGQVLPW